jgi:hypothetical protein
MSFQLAPRDPAVPEVFAVDEHDRRERNSMPHNQATPFLRRQMNGSHAKRRNFGQLAQDTDGIFTKVASGSGDHQDIDYFRHVELAISAPAAEWQ